MGFMLLGAILMTIFFWIIIENSYIDESRWVALNGLWVGALMGAFIAIVVGAILHSEVAMFEIYKQDITELRPIKDNYYSIVEHQNGTDVYYLQQSNMPSHITLNKSAGVIKEIKYIESNKGTLYENYYRYKSSILRVMIFNTDGMVPTNDYTLEIPKGSISYGK